LWSDEWRDNNRDQVNKTERARYAKDPAKHIAKVARLMPIRGIVMDVAQFAQEFDFDTDHLLVLGYSITRQAVAENVYNGVWRSTHIEVAA
jgi:hypothetical protein